MASPDRHTELTARLSSLIDLLAEDASCPPPPPEAASLWSEASIRAYFSSNGQTLPHGFAPIDTSLPGGGLPQAVEGAPEAPAVLKAAQAKLTVAEYRAAAFSCGIPPRVHGLFPPNCPVLKAIAADRSLVPFQKQLLDGRSGVLRCAEVSWPVGDDAALRGMDLRYFTQGPGPSLGAKATLVAALRYGYRAGIGGEGFFLSAHGGAVESAFDEATAELVKASLGPLATTIEFTAKIKKPVPLHTSLRLECSIVSVAGLRVNTVGRLLDGNVELATCTAQLVDLGQLRAANGGA